MILFLVEHLRLPKLKGNIDSKIILPHVKENILKGKKTVK